jgi:hypothetical protein
LPRACECRLELRLRYGRELLPLRGPVAGDAEIGEGAAIGNFVAPSD